MKLPGWLWLAVMIGSLYLLGKWAYAVIFLPVTTKPTAVSLVSTLTVIILILLIICSLAFIGISNARKDWLIDQRKWLLINWFSHIKWCHRKESDLGPLPYQGRYVDFELCFAEFTSRNFLLDVLTCMWLRERATGYCSREGSDLVIIYKIFP